MVICQARQFVQFGNNIKVVSDDAPSKAICIFTLFVMLA